MPPESCGENPPRLALRQLILARDLSHRRAAFAGAAHLAVAKQAAHRGRARHFDELARVVAAQRARVAYADQLHQLATLVRLARQVEPRAAEALGDSERGGERGDARHLRERSRQSGEEFLVLIRRGHVKVA